MLEDGVWVDRPPAALLRVRNRPWIDNRVIALAARRWRRRLGREGPGPLVTYVFHPRLWPYARAVRPDILLYHAYDLFNAQVGWNSTMAGHEREMIRKADLVLGSSEVICAELRAQGAAAPVLLPNAADFGAFALDRGSAPPPADLAGIPGPRVGYLGKLSRKVDLALVTALATRHPDWQFVFVGSHDNRDAESAAGFAAASARANIHFLGFKDHTLLPQYAAQMDANIIAHRIEDGLWTHGTFPLKLFEYLAAGAPVVSADIPSVRPFSAVVTIARTLDDWSSALTQAITSSGDAGAREARRAVARENTWDQRVATIDALLQPLIAARTHAD